MWSLNEFGLADWGKLAALVLTGIFAIIALTKDNKDKSTGKLNKWGKLTLVGIVLSSGGGLLTQVAESSHNAHVERKRYSEIMRLLTPLKITEIYGSLLVPCKDAAYTHYCDDLQAFASHDRNAIIPESTYTAFPGGNHTPIKLELMFFATEKDAEETYEQMASSGRSFVPGKYYEYMISWALPLIPGTYSKCGVSGFIDTPSHKVVLGVNQGIHRCSPNRVDNPAGLESHRDLAALVVGVVAIPDPIQGPGIPFTRVPPLQPTGIYVQFSDGTTAHVSHLTSLPHDSMLYVGKIATGTGR